MKLIALSIMGPDKQPIKVQSVSGMPTGGLDTLIKAIKTGLAFITLFAIVFGLIILIYSGWQWMTSAGDKQKVQQARQRIGFTIVGLVIVFISYFILNILGVYFGVNLLKLP